MAATASVRVVKSFLFKGGVRLWSNRYHFTGGTPADASHWNTLFDNITNAEKTCFFANNTIVEALGYGPGTDVPVAQKTYSVAGTLTPAGTDFPTPGEVAGLIRYTTSARSVKNHPIYCFNYYHGVYTDSLVAGHDKIAPSFKTAMDVYGAKWVTGFSDGAITATRSSPVGHICNGHLVEEWVTHRDFPSTTSV